MRRTARIMGGARVPLAGSTHRPVGAEENTNKFTTLSVGKTELVADHEGDLGVDGLTTLSGTAAKVLLANPKITYEKATHQFAASTCTEPHPEFHSAENASVMTQGNLLPPTGIIGS